MTLSLPRRLLAHAGLAALSLGLIAASSLVAAAAPKAEQRVLLVLSSQGQPEDKGKLGYDFHEFALAAEVLKANGLAFDIASPKGGAVLGEQADESAAVRAQADPALMARLQATLPIANLKSGEYAAAVVIGGKGPMFDLHSNQALQDLLGRIHDQGGVLGAVCHGPAALLNVKLANGSSLLHGRRVTGFSNAEDRRFSKGLLERFPFMLEDALRERGARYESRGLMLPLVVRDERLITGQNPLATPTMVEAVLEALGRKPAPREPGVEEATLELIELHLAGNPAGARAALAARPARYQPILMGGYGHLLSETETSPERLAIAVSLLRHAQESVPTHAGVNTALARTLVKVGQKAEAIALLKAFLDKQPSSPRARQLLTELEA